MQKYFISNYKDYSCKNSLQKQGRESLKWMQHTLVLDLPQLEKSLRSRIDLKNMGNTRCTPLELEFIYPKSDGGVGYCGIKEQYMFFIIPVKEEYLDDTASGSFEKLHQFCKSYQEVRLYQKEYESLLLMSGTDVAEKLKRFNHTLDSKYSQLDTLIMDFLFEVYEEKEVSND